MHDAGAVTGLGFNLLRHSRDKYRGQHCEHQHNTSHGLFVPSFSPNVVRPGDSLRSLLDGCGLLGSYLGISTAASTANINTTRLMACLFLPLVRMLCVQETPSEVSWTVVVSWVPAAARHFSQGVAAASGCRGRS